MKLNRNLIASLFLIFAYTSCASDDSSSEEPSPRAASDNKGGATTAAAKGNPDDEESMVQAKAETKGKLAIVTTTLNNDVGLEGSLGASVLSDSLMALDDLARKEPENISLLTTYLALLRLHGTSPQTYDNYSRKGGAKGAKSFWFLVEAGYGALKKKDYGLADYFFNKAEKLPNNSPTMKAAVQHCYGIRYLMMGKTQTGIAAMRKAAETQPPYLPALLTLGFLGLKSGDVVGAERIFRTATSAFSSSVNARVGLATALRGRGKADEAKQILEPLYKSHAQERRIVWNYALVLNDGSETQKEAMDVLTKYFQLPGSVPEIDAKANTLITKLQRPTPPAPKPTAPNGAGAAAAAKAPEVAKPTAAATKAAAASQDAGADEKAE